MKFGIESLPFHDFPFEVMAAEVANLGFRAVNLWSSTPPLAAHVDVVKDDPWEVRRRLSAFGLIPTAVTMYGKSKQEISEGIRFAAALGAERVIFDCEANFSTFVGEFLPPLLAVAEHHGIDICVENHLTVPFTADFERGGHEGERWEEAVDNAAQIKRLVTEVDHPNLKVCLAPPHLWVMGETITEVALFLLERKKLGFFYVWDISRFYARGTDGLNFGPGEEQLPRLGGTLDHGLILRTLARSGYQGWASLKCHGTAGWSLEKVRTRLQQSRDYVLRSTGDDVLQTSLSAQRWEDYEQ